MQNTLKGFVVGALALAGATFATADAQAMPVQPLSPTVTADAGAAIEHVFYYGYGYRRPFVRGYGYRRPFLGYRRFGYGYGYRRPFLGYRRPLGYGYRRF